MEKKSWQENGIAARVLCDKDIVLAIKTGPLLAFKGLQKECHIISLAGHWLLQTPAEQNTVPFLGERVILSPSLSALAVSTLAAILGNVSLSGVCECAKIAARKRPKHQSQWAPSAGSFCSNRFEMIGICLGNRFALNAVPASFPRGCR